MGVKNLEEYSEKVYWFYNKKWEKNSQAPGCDVTVGDVTQLAEKREGQVGSIATEALIV